MRGVVHQAQSTLLRYPSAPGLLLDLFPDMPGGNATVCTSPNAHMESAQ